MSNIFRHISFIAAETPEAQTIYQKLIKTYGQVDPMQADVLVVISGDGLMLQSLHRYQHLNLPVYGVNCGSVGFLMNALHTENLQERLSQANPTRIYPLKMVATTADGHHHEAYALNEVSLFRESSQAAKIQIQVDGVVRVDELVCDGVMVATAAGSTAYNMSVHGPIIPVGANLLALTPISAFRPRRWRGALLPDRAQVTFRVLEPVKRPVSVAADQQQVQHVTEIHVAQDSKKPYTLLFDQDHNLEDRILREQFLS